MSATAAEIPGFTRHKSGGWVRSYRGQTVWCGTKDVSRDEVEETFQAKRKLIDEGAALEGAPLIYREVLSQFLGAMRLRVESGKPRPLSSRTYHNYIEILNDFGMFIGGDFVFSAIGPEQFTAYARKYAHYKASGFDSIVTRVSALFNWAVEAELIDRYRPGPVFQRPGKQAIRDERISRQRRFSAEEIGKLYRSATPLWRCFIALGICCAFNNSDVGNLTRTAVDLDAGLIDFRRRKEGKIRRVCPLPAVVVTELRKYHRPDPAGRPFAQFFFLTRDGHPYCRTRTDTFKPSDAISRLFPHVMKSAGVAHIDGRNFAGLRTSFANLAPHGWREELELIMGHAGSSMLADHYLETVGVDRLRELVNIIWTQVNTQAPTSAAIEVSHV